MMPSAGRIEGERAEKIFCTAICAFSVCGTEVCRPDGWQDRPK